MQGTNPPPFILALQAKNADRPKHGGDVGDMVSDHGDMGYPDMGGLGGIIPGEFDLLESSSPLVSGPIGVHNNTRPLEVP